MTKQTRSKIGEMVLISVFCILSVYITLVGTVFVGTPSVLSRSMNIVAQHLTILRPCTKKKAAVDGKPVPSPCSSEERIRLVQMDEPAAVDETGS
jgi:hypothetical protein